MALEQQTAAPATPEERRWALRTELYELQRVIFSHCLACEGGKWSPEMDELLWKKVLGAEAPSFPWESIPGQLDHDLACVRSQHENVGRPLATLPPFEREDTNLSVEQEIDLLEAKIRYLKDAVRRHASNSQKKPCWQHTEELYAARNLIMSAGPIVKPRPNLKDCKQHCVTFSTRLYAALQARNGTVVDSAPVQRVDLGTDRVAAAQKEMPAETVAETSTALDGAGDGSQRS
jgi:hypothetical protein